LDAGKASIQLLQMIIEGSLVDDDQNIVDLSLHIFNIAKELITRAAHHHR
jgi:hypothetical protein